MSAYKKFLKIKKAADKRTSHFGFLLIGGFSIFLDYHSDLSIGLKGFTRYYLNRHLPSIYCY